MFAELLQPLLPPFKSTGRDRSMKALVLPQFSHPPNFNRMQTAQWHQEWQHCQHLKQSSLQGLLAASAMS